MKKSKPAPAPELNTLYYLDLFKKQYDIRSDYGASKKLGLTPSAVTNYRMGFSEMNDQTCIRMAGFLDTHPGLLICMIRKLRARTPEEKAVWQSLYDGILRLNPKLNVFTGN